MAAGERVNGPIPATDQAQLWKKSSIYRVPGFLKDLNKKAFEPQVVSFGPYHHDDPRLRPMEEHKRRALHHFLKRANKPWGDFVSGMEEIVQQLQDSYQDLDEKWRRDRDRFLQLMIVDGCFMLEVMRLASHSVKYYSSNDPIFSKHGMMYNLLHIWRDMLMVENQLPLLVLSKLVAVESGNTEVEGKINKQVLKFVAPNVMVVVGDLGLHPLYLYRESLIKLPEKKLRPGVEPSCCPGNSRLWLQLARIWKCASDSQDASADSQNVQDASADVQDASADSQDVQDASQNVQNASADVQDASADSQDVQNASQNVQDASADVQDASADCQDETSWQSADSLTRRTKIVHHLYPTNLLRCGGGLDFPARRPNSDSSDYSYSADSQAFIRSALELHEAGIHFKKSKTKSLQDITFDGNVLSLPVIVVDDATEFVFLNLMAFERLHVGAGNEVSSYVFFMDDIIDSAQDVSLLRSKGIIKSCGGSDEAVANIFNALSKEVVRFDSDGNLNDVNQKLNDYCKKRWNVWRANLIRTYFRSPWSFISLAAAIILLALTVSQTLYTILPYYYRH